MWRDFCGVGVPGEEAVRKPGSVLASLQRDQGVNDQTVNVRQKTVPGMVIISPEDAAYSSSPRMEVAHQALGLFGRQM